MKIADAAAAGTKFDIVHDSIDDLKAGRNTELAANAARYPFVPKALIDHISQVAGLAMARAGWTSEENH